MKEIVSKKKVPVTDMDYVVLYARNLKMDNKHFRSHKMLIDSQIKSSNSFFKNMFGDGEEFKRKSREYLKKLGK